MEMEGFRDYMEAKQSATSKRNRFLNFWRSLRNNTPIPMVPMPKDHKGTTKGEDTVRVSGSAAFVTSMMTRMKDLMLFETEASKLQISFQQSVYVKKSGEPTYILYINAVER